MTAVITILILAIARYLSVVYLAVIYATLVPTLMISTLGETIAQPPGYQIETQPRYQIIGNTTSPLPAQIHQKITQGEFIDFALLLRTYVRPHSLMLLLTAWL